VRESLKTCSSRRAPPGLKANRKALRRSWNVSKATPKMSLCGDWKSRSSPAMIALCGAGSRLTAARYRIRSS
jgi:hypothetical protein